MAQNLTPWLSDPIVGAGGGSTGGPLASPPRVAPAPSVTYRPLSPEEVRQRGLNPQRSWQIGSDGKVDDLGALPAPGGTGMNANQQRAAARVANLDALVTQVNRVQDLYNRNLRDEALPLLSALGEFLPFEENRRFDAASAGLAEQGLAAFRVPGVGAQSDTELRQFVAANKPSASDYDATIEEKLLQLRQRVDANRRSLGLPPAQWTGLDTGTTTEDEAPPGVAPPADSPPPAPGSDMERPFTPAGPGAAPATSGTRTVPDPAGAALTPEYRERLAAGQSAEEILGWLRSKGVTPETLMGAMAQIRYRQQNPNVPIESYSITSTKEVPLSLYDRAANAAGNFELPGGFSPGAYAVGAGQFLSGNTLDNLTSDPERARLSTDVMRASNPGSTMTGEITGGVLSALGGELALARAGMASGLARGTVADMFMGGTNAAGAADAPGDSRLGSGVVGALAGGGGSLGGYGVTRALQRSAGALYTPVSRTMGRDPDVATRQVATALGDDGLTPRDAAARLQAAQDRGSPMAIADLGENSRELLASVGRQKGASRTTAQTFAKDRQAQQLERIGESVRRELGPTANIREAGESLMEQARTQAEPLYQQAFDAPGAGAVAPRLENLLNRPSARQAMTRANRIAAEEGVDPKTLGFTLDAQGEVVLTQEPSWQTLHYIKLGLDDVIEGYRDKTTGRLMLDTEGRAINATLRGMLRIIDEVNPQYAAARAAYAGPARLKGALEQGVGIMSRDPDDILANMRDMSPSEVEMYRLGARKGIMNLLEGKGDFADKVNALIGTPKKRLALSRVFGNTDGFGRLQDVLGDEAAMGQTYKAVATGSPTAGRMAFDEGAAEGVKTAVELGQAAKSGGLTGLAVAGWLRLAEAARMGVGAAGDAARAQIADMLTAATPDQLKDIARQLRRPIARQRLQGRAQRRIARGVAGTTGALSGVAAAGTTGGQ